MPSRNPVDVTEAAKFVVVGVANTLLTLSIIFVGITFLGMGDVRANALGYILGVLQSFFLSSRFVFAYKGPQLTALARFLTVALASYLLNLITVLMVLNVLGLHSYIAHVAGNVVYTVNAYLMNKYVVFRR